MRTTNPLPLLLASTLAFVPGCDDEFDADLPRDDDEVSLRCSGASCTIGGLGNTSLIGDHALSNLTEAFNSNANNLSARVRVAGATAYWGPTLTNVTEVDVEADGELRLKLGTAGWISGTAVKNATFNLIVTPHDVNRPAFAGKLLISDVVCAPGKVDPTMTICKYEFLTDVKPADTVMYPMSTKKWGWYHTCPNEDENGQLTGFEKHAAVLSPQSTLVASYLSTPRIDPSASQFILGCLNGAVSKGQYHLNAFYDATAYRGLATTQRSAMLLMWMAWHHGKSRTEPGMMISPRDPIGGLFDWTSDPNWGIEAGYTVSGASCRGAELPLGLHRLFEDPVNTLIGWSSLPVCTAGSIDSMAVLGVKVSKL